VNIRSEEVSIHTVTLLQSLPDKALVELSKACEPSSQGWLVDSTGKVAPRIEGMAVTVSGRVASLPGNPLAILIVAEKLAWEQRPDAMPMWSMDLGSGAPLPKADLIENRLKYLSRHIEDGAPRRVFGASLESSFFHVSWGLIQLSTGVEVEKCGNAFQSMPGRHLFPSIDDQQRWTALAVVARVCDLDVEEPTTCYKCGEVPKLVPGEGYACACGTKSR
jgi:hypothetical protein